MIDDVLSLFGARPAGAEPGTFHGVVTGTVIDVLDPLSLGRVKVRLPFLDAVDPSPWARVAVPAASQLAGHYFIPDVGDEVLVAFEHGAVHAPYVIGCLWTAQAPPPLQSPLPQIRAIRTPGGTQLVFTDTPSSVTLQTSPTAAAAMPTTGSPTGPHTTLSVADSGIEATSPTSVALKVGGSSIEVTTDGITLRIGGNSIRLTAGGIQVSASGNLELVSAGSCSVTGAVVKINS